MLGVTIEELAEKVAALGALNSGKAEGAARRHHWTYSENARDLEQGEVFRLENAPADSKLLQQGFVYLLHGKTPIRCKQCPKKFADADATRMHYRHAHGEAVA
jgi:hypothetical protein